jgi:membrane-associated phospholipid phosphatase
MSASTSSTTAWSDDDAPATERRRWDGAWPLKRNEILQLLAAYVVVVGLWSLVGRAYTAWTAPNVITRFDDRVANWMVDNRTGFLNDAAKACGYLADSYYKIGASVVIFLVFLWVWRRWYEAVYIGLPLVFEASAFIVITHLVQRDRPEVEQLIKSEITTSFPSGHVAAATVYAAIAVIVFKHTTATWARSVAVVLAVIVPLVVAWARVYQGAHFLTDALAGIVLGATSLVITDRVLARHEPDGLRRPSEDADAPG